MDETERLHTLEKIQHYKEELRKLDEEERSLSEKNGLSTEDVQALEARMTDEDRAKVQAGVEERMQLIKRDFEFRLAANSNATRPRNSARRHQSKI